MAIGERMMSRFLPSVVSLHVDMIADPCWCSSASSPEFLLVFFSVPSDVPSLFACHRNQPLLPSRRRHRSSWSAWIGALRLDFLPSRCLHLHFLRAPAGYNILTSVITYDDKREYIRKRRMFQKWFVQYIRQRRIFQVRVTSIST